MALLRKLPQVIESTHGSEYLPETLTGRDLKGKTLGVIGAGHIGQKAIRIGRGFNMDVLAYDAFPNKELEMQLDFTYATLEEVLAKADVVSLHTPLSPLTHHIINAQRLSIMKTSAVLINTARGELVDTGALIQALEADQIAGAALDVVEGEAVLNYDEEAALLRSNEIPADLMRHGMEISTLQRMPNVIITPHNAFNTVEAIERINNTTVQNIIGYWYGNSPNKVQSPKSSGPGKLLLVRHAESEWNATGRWSGLRNVHLTEKGFHEAALLGLEIKSKNIKIDHAFCSEQIRTRETLSGILDASQQFDVPIERSAAINERDYGKYTGKNKWEMKEMLGEEKWESIRRGWDVEVPGGETLRAVFERAVPFYKEHALPLLRAGKNVMIVAHGNSIRSLMKYIESINDEDVLHLDMIFGTIVQYEVDDEGRKVTRQDFRINSPPPNA